MLPIVSHPAYDARDVSDNHRFPMRKFSALRDHLVARALVTSEAAFHRPGLASRALLAGAHDPAYVDAVLGQNLDARAARKIGFPITAGVARRARAAVGGTVLAAHLALKEGAAANTAGGSHHADRDGGAGFCVFNDVAVAARHLLGEGLADRILVVDLDVHQGDGTARIFASDPRVFTLSVHCGENWPRRKASSDLDVALPPATGDSAYLHAVEVALDEALAAARPDIVFYNAGIDVHADDRLGLLSLTDDGLLARDRLVARRVIGANIPAVGVLGGGYSRDVASLARRHGFLHHALGEALQRRSPAATVAAL